MVSFQCRRLLWEVVDVQVEVVHAEGGTDGVFYGVFDLLQTAGQETVNSLQLQLRPLQQSVCFPVRSQIIYGVGGRCRTGFTAGCLDADLKSPLLLLMKIVEKSVTIMEEYMLHLHKECNKQVGFKIKLFLEIKEGRDSKRYNLETEAR